MRSRDTLSEIGISTPRLIPLFSISTFNRPPAGVCLIAFCACSQVGFGTPLIDRILSPVCKEFADPARVFGQSHHLNGLIKKGRVRQTDGDEQPREQKNREN